MEREAVQKRRHCQFSVSAAADVRHKYIGAAHQKYIDAVHHKYVDVHQDNTEHLGVGTGLNGLVTIELEGIVTVHCDENQSPEILRDQMISVVATIIWIVFKLQAEIAQRSTYKVVLAVPL